MTVQNWYGRREHSIRYCGKWTGIGHWRNAGGNRTGISSRYRGREWQWWSGTGDSATETGNATENAGENMSANLSQSAGAMHRYQIFLRIQEVIIWHQKMPLIYQAEQQTVLPGIIRWKKGTAWCLSAKLFYHTTAMIPEICNANQIENMDMIYEGSSYYCRKLSGLTVKMHYDISDERKCLFLLREWSNKGWNMYIRQGSERRKEMKKRRKK